MLRNENEFLGGVSGGFQTFTANFVFILCVCLYAVCYQQLLNKFEIELQRCFSRRIPHLIQGSWVLYIVYKNWILWE